MVKMGRVLRTLAAVLAGLALVAALPAPCGCAPERRAPAQVTGHECCAPPVGMSAADRGCCEGTSGTVEAVPSRAGPPTVAPVAVVFLRVEAPSALRRLAHPSVPSAPSPPPTVLRV